MSLCDDETMQQLIEAMQTEQNQVERVDALLAKFPEDARLHFLRGSMLVGLGRLIEAHHALSRAVALAPDFEIARFQLGFFQLTSGEAENALETWGRLGREIGELKAPWSIAVDSQNTVYVVDSANNRVVRFQWQ